MTIQQLERKATEMEYQLAELRREIRQLQPAPTVAETFGMFADDAEFDEIVRHGREYRDQVNAEAPSC